MTDEHATPRSFPKSLGQPLTVADLLDRVPEAPEKIIGAPDTWIETVAALDDGVSGCFCFCVEKGARAERALAGSKASVIVTSADPAEERGRCFIKVADPMRWYFAAIRVLFAQAPGKGIHPTAIVGAGVELGSDVELGPYAVIGDRVRIGANSRIEAGTHIHDHTVIGARCSLGANCSIGGAGLATGRDGDGRLESFAHLGRAIIADDVEMGAGCIIVRGILKDTVVGRGTKIANMVNIGHNCRVGADCWISSGVVMSGSAILEPRAMIGAGVFLKNHVVVGADAQVGLGSVVTRNVQPDALVFGNPANPIPKTFKF